MAETSGLYKQVATSCACGGNMAWVRIRPSGAEEMVGCICHTFAAPYDCIHVPTSVPGVVFTAEDFMRCCSMSSFRQMANEANRMLTAEIAKAAQPAAMERLRQLPPWLRRIGADLSHWSEADCKDPDDLPEGEEAPTDPDCCWKCQLEYTANAIEAALAALQPSEPQPKAKEATQDERPPKERIDDILKNRKWAIEHFHMRYEARRDYLQLCAEIDHLRAASASKEPKP